MADVHPNIGAIAGDFSRPAVIIQKKTGAVLAAPESTQGGG